MSEYLQPNGFEGLSGGFSQEDIDLFNSEIDKMSHDVYDNGSEGLRARWDYYQLSERPVDFHDLAIEKTVKNASNTILDVGCGTGILLAKLRENHAHIGPLVGIDPNRGMFCSTINAERENPQTVALDFLETSAERLPIATASVDNVFSMFMLYHVQNVGYALSEMARVTKPDGSIAIATSGDGNKSQHRKFEAAIASYSGVLPPRPFSAHFDNDVANLTLPLFFKEVEKADPQICDAIITAETLPIYLASLASMREDYIPKISTEEWLRAVNAVVIPPIMADIEKNGCFRDTIERYLYICKNA